MHRDRLPDMLITMETTTWSQVGCIPKLGSK